MMVAQAKVDIGEVAVQRMSAAIGLLYKSVGAALVILGGLGGIGYFTASSSVKQAVDSKVNDWLSVESKDSIVKMSLEKIRMRVVLDSLVVRLAREKTDGHSDMNYALSGIERSRLVAYMRDPETAMTDFRDCARILSASFGIFGVQYSLPEIDQMLKAVMGDKDFDNEKRYILLESLKGYPGVYGYALQTLKSSDAPDSWRAAAFETVVRFQSKEAVSYAEANLLKTESVGFQQKMANLLAHEEKSPSLDLWLSSQLKVDRGALSWISIAEEVVPSRDFSQNEFEESQRAKRSGKYLFVAIEHGAKLMDCSFSGAIDLCFEIRRTSYSLNRPKALFKNDIVLSEVVRLAREKKYDPAKLVSALTLEGTGQEIFGIRAELGGATLMTERFGRVSKDNVRGTVLLASGRRKGSDAGQAPVYVSFRASDGKWVHDVVTDYSDFYDATLHFSFDEQAIQAMEMRHFAANYSQ